LTAQRESRYKESTETRNNKMANDKTVEERILEHYRGDNGDWVVARGKVTEAKFLKEAVARIKSLKRDSRENYEAYQKAVAEKREINALRNKLERDEKEFTRYVTSLLNDMQSKCNTMQRRLDAVKTSHEKP
jgi:cytochrome b involved in lipid metabolism